MSVLGGILERGSRAAEREGLLELAPPDGPEVTTSTRLEGPMGLLHAVEGVGSETPPGFQPTVDPGTGAVVVFDGRLDGRADLAATLAAGPINHVTDPELILASYRRWGVSCPAHLVGDYAFAIWDPRERRLLMARDPLGARTLFFSEWGGTLRFASTLEQMLRVPGIPTDLDDLAIARYLYGDTRPTPGNGHYRHIHLLPGGQTLTVASRGELELATFWAWPDEPPELRPLTADDDQRFLEIFTTAVQERLRSTHPVAVMLSGGLDSGAVASVAGALHQASGIPPVRTYSSVFDSERFKSVDERRYIKSVVERYNLPHRDLPADTQWPLSFFETWRPVFNEPLFAAFDGTLYQPLAAARADGARTMLMGHLGDLIVGGSTRWLINLLGPGSLGELRRQVRGHALIRGGTVWRSLAATVLFRLLPARLQGSVEYRRGPRLEAWMTPQLRRGGDVDPRRPAYGGRAAWWHELRDGFGLVGQGRAGGYMDRMFRLFGLEQRQPFLDTRLMMLMLTMPPQGLYSEGLQKTILRRSLAGFLPPIVRDRPDKATFAPLAEYGLRGPYRSFVELLTRSSLIVDAGLVAERPWRRSMNTFLDGEEPLSWGAWRSITLEMWLRHRAGTLPPLG